MVISKKIYWLASYPKSGNTWIRMFINAFMTKFPLNINSAYQYVTGDLRPAILQLTCAEKIENLSHSEQYLYRPAMLLNALKLAPTHTICLKTHSAKVAVDGIHAIPLPISEKAIYLVRDPRDVVISLSHHLGYTIDETIEFMNTPNQGGELQEVKLVHILLTWSGHVESWTIKNDNLPYVAIKYEDLLINTTIFHEILKLLNLQLINDYEERFDLAVKETHFKNLQKLENKHGFIEKGVRDKFFRVGKAEQWKKVLTRKQVDTIISHHREVMTYFGYI